MFFHRSSENRLEKYPPFPPPLTQRKSHGLSNSRSLLKKFRFWKKQEKLPSFSSQVYSERVRKSPSFLPGAAAKICSCVLARRRSLSGTGTDFFRIAQFRPLPKDLQLFPDSSGEALRRKKEKTFPKAFLSRSEGSRNARRGFSGKNWKLISSAHDPAACRNIIIVAKIGISGSFLHFPESDFPTPGFSETPTPPTAATAVLYLIIFSIFSILSSVRSSQ